MQNTYIDVNDVLRLRFTLMSKMDMYAFKSLCELKKSI